MLFFYICKQFIKGNWKICVLSITVHMYCIASENNNNNNNKSMQSTWNNHREQKNKNFIEWMKSTALFFYSWTPFSILILYSDYLEL